MIASLAIPLISLPILIKENSTVKPFISSWSIYENSNPGTITTNAGNHPDWITLFISIYLVVTLVMLTRLIKSLWTIWCVYRNQAFRYVGNIRIVEGNRQINNCSFLDTIFLIPGGLTREEYDHIIRHEEYHIRYRHTYDKLFMNLIQAIFWINPVIYFYRRSIEEVHEFEVDAMLVEQIDKKEYAHFLLQVVINEQSRLLNCFSTKPLKARVEMLFSSRSKKIKKITYFIGLPVILYTVMSFSIRNMAGLQQQIPAIDQTILQQKDLKTKNTITPGIKRENKILKDIVAPPVKKNDPAALLSLPAIFPKDHKANEPLHPAEGANVVTGNDRSMTGIHEPTANPSISDPPAFITRDQKKDDEGNDYDEVKLQFGKYHLQGNVTRDGKLLFIIAGKKYKEEEIRKMPADEIARFKCPCKVQIREKEKEPLILNEYEGIVEISGNN